MHNYPVGIIVKSVIAFFNSVLFFFQLRVPGTFEFQVKEFSSFFKSSSYNILIN